MKIINITRKTTIAENAVEAKGVAARTKGLLGTTKPQAMIFHTRFGIHTIGLKYPIDVLILDKNKNVIQIKEHLNPNTIYLWDIRYNLVIELPSKSVASSKTRINDKVKIT